MTYGIKRPEENKVRFETKSDLRGKFVKGEVEGEVEGETETTIDDDAWDEATFIAANSIYGKMANPPRFVGPLERMEAENSILHESIATLHETLERIEKKLAESDVRFAFVQARCLILVETNRIGTLGEYESGREPRLATIASSLSKIRRGETVTLIIEPFLPCKNIVLEVVEPFVIRAVRIGCRDQIYSYADPAARTITCPDTCSPGERITIDVTWPA